MKINKLLLFFCETKRSIDTFAPARLSSSFSFFKLKQWWLLSLEAHASPRISFLCVASKRNQVRSGKELKMKGNRATPAHHTQTRPFNGRHTALLTSMCNGLATHLFSSKAGAYITQTQRHKHKDTLTDTHKHFVCLRTRPIMLGPSSSSS